MVLMQGPLLKWTNMMKGYQQRWFVLDEINGLLSYYTSPEKLIRGDRRGYLRLRDAILGIEDDDDTIFSITSDTEVFHCKAHSMKERDEWIKCLADTIELFQRKRRKYYYYQPNRLNNKDSANKQKYRNNYKSNALSNNKQLTVYNNSENNDEKILNDFNKYLTETDSYLQLLIKQFNRLELKIDSLKNIDNNDSDNANENERKQKQLIQLKERSTYFLDSIKHTIVLLQIAKNLKFPVNGIYDHKQEQQHTHENSSERSKSIQNQQQQINQKSKLTNDNENNDHTILKAEEANESLKIVDKNAVQINSNIPNNQPQSSKSFRSAQATLEFGNNNINNNDQSLIDSSDFGYDDDDDDDDDYFFDAHDESENSDYYENDENSSTSMTTTKMPITKNSKKLMRTAPTPNTVTSFDNNNNNGASVVVVGASDNNFDKLYESSDDSIDDELCSMQSHGSVISHLISQVKIGMDLTKVALPTFILERRSLLEMYADFFAHADIFCSIPDYKTPEERMIQVVRWYLSAFHAGRKSSLAKKPYNPILGEVFKCYWNLSTSSPTSTDNYNSQLPWAKSSDLIFIAEQVSHHPPISAFYAENVEKRIMCSAQIWTKSKFLGLSIGVNNIGKGTIYLLDHDEEYVCTFPSAYGRSILTEPWFEFGGNVQIECSKSGYLAKIDFLTKPFYGGKRNRINAEIFDPNKKSIMTITGEWNGKMEAKYVNKNANDSNIKLKLPQPFVDTKTMPVIRKQVKPINEQEEYESRNLWKYVTLALKNQNVDEATESKYRIEQKQRDLVKEREQNNIKWQNRMFHTIGDNLWSYNEPLTIRKR